MGLPWAAVVLSVGCCACGPSTTGEPAETREPLAAGVASEQGESTLPEDALTLELLRADAATARVGFERLLGDQLALLARLLERRVEDTTELARGANALRRVASIVRSWQAAELELRRRGQPTPHAVLSQVLSAARQMDAHAQAIGTFEAALPRPSHEDHRARDIRAARRDVGRVLLQCNVFLRGTAQQESRRDLIDAARRYVDAPAGVEAFDELYGPDPEGAFNLRPRAPRGAPRAPTPTSRP